MWKFLPAEAVPFMVAAVQAPGAGSLSGKPPAGPGREAVGRQLLSLVFGLQDGQGLPGMLVRARALVPGEPAEEEGRH